MQNLPNRLHRQLHRSRFLLYSISLPLLAFSLPALADSAMRILYVLFGFSLIIFLHELGHFVIARLCSVKCLAFSLGIGPRAFGWRKGAGLSFGPDRWDPEYKISKNKKSKNLENAEAITTHSDLPTSADEPPHPANIGVTDYRLSWLPLGGYVRMLGQDDMDPTKVSKDPHAFNMRPIWQRMCIVSAGVIMNLIFAFVAFSIIFRVGVKFPTADVGFVRYNSPADKAGLKMGDRIVAIDNQTPRSGGFIEFTDVVIACTLSDGKTPIAFDYLTPGDDQIHHASILPVKPPEGGFLAIGVQQMPSLNLVPSLDTIQDSIKEHETPVAEGGFGDPDGAKQMEKLESFLHGGQITAADGQPVSSYLELYNHVQTENGKPVTLTIHDPAGKTPDASVTLKPRLETQPGVEAFPLLFGLGPVTKAGKTVPGEPAEKAGIKEDDLILAVGDRQWPTMKQFGEKIKENPDKPIDIVVLRDDRQKTLTVNLSDRKEKSFLGIPYGPIHGYLGLNYGAAIDNLIVANHEGGSGPAASVIGPNNLVKITSVDDKPVASWLEVYALLKTKKPGDSVTFNFLPITPPAATTSAPATESAVTASQPALRSLTLTIDQALVTQLARQTHYMLNIPVEVTQKTQQAQTITSASLMGTEHTEKFIEQVYMTLAGLVRGTIDPGNLHGIVGITKVGYDVQERGMAWFWYLMAIVSVNLAVVNFLPLPIVDGGLFLLLILEKVRGKPLSLKVQSAIQIVGIVLLAGMFIFVTFNDIKLFGK